MKNFFSQEWAKLKEMNFTDKRQYIWEYYKLHILFTVLGLFIMGSLINIWFINPPKRDYLYIAWQAGHVSFESLDDLGERLSVIVSDSDRYRVTVSSYMMPEDPQMIQAMATRFHALLTIGGLHLMLATEQGIQEGADAGLIRPPTEVLEIVRELNPAMYDELTGRVLILTYTPGEGEDAPTFTDEIAINIGGAPLLLDVGLTMDDLYLGIVSNIQHFDEIARALIIMFSEDIYAER